MPQNLQQKFPSLNQPLVDANGRVTQGWMQFLLNLWNRTGQSLANFATVVVGYAPSTTGTLNVPVGVLADVDTGKLLANISAASAPPKPNTLSDFLDLVVGNSLGAILTRTEDGWSILLPGTDTQVLTAQGEGKDILWKDVVGLPSIADGDILANLSGADAVPEAHTVSEVLDYVFSSLEGSLLFRGSTGWETLAIGAANQVLTSDGTTLEWTEGSNLEIDKDGSPVTVATTNIDFTGPGSVVSQPSSNHAQVLIVGSLPLVNGDLPGPGLITDPTTGQCILVPLQ